MKDNIAIFIATHKHYEYPNDQGYIPIQVGSEKSQRKLDIQKDNIGNHISQKNEFFCELTALYWVWKNYQLNNIDYIGLVHYRRYFFGSDLSLKGLKIASSKEILTQINGYDAIVPKKRNYYIETVYDHYKNAHYQNDIDLVKEIISQYHPAYLSSFNYVISGKKVYLFNMFVLKKEMAISYFEWLFDILFKLEEQIDIKDYSIYQKRVFGFIAERLFNVWIIKNELKIKELKVINLEKENYLTKGIEFLLRKFTKGNKK